MPSAVYRLALLTSSLLAAPAIAANAEAEAQPDRDYLPTDIIVTGERDRYGLDDGSTATKTPTPLIDVPQGVSFITEDQLEDQSVRQLGEALRYVPGISLETGEGHRDEVFIRGQETTADFYIDGLRDDAQYYRPLYNIDRIEVLKGANALIFGRGAGGGAINRVAKTAKVGRESLAGDASIDSFGGFAVLGDVNHTLNDAVAVRLNATYEEFANDRDFYEGRFIGVSPTLTVEPGPYSRLTASYTYDDDSRVTDRGVPALGNRPLTGFDETFFGDPDFNDSRAIAHIGRLRGEHEFAPGLTANATLQFADYDKIYANLVPSGTDGNTVAFGGYEDAQDRQNLIGQANLVWETEGDFLSSTLLVWLALVGQDSLNTRRTVSFPNGNRAALQDVITPPAFTLNPISRSRNSRLDTFSIYAQEQLGLGEYVQIIAGLRYDRFDLTTFDGIAIESVSRIDDRVSPRLGLIVKPDPRLSFYASFAESFLPQSGDQFFILSQQDAALEPETFTNYEIGAKWAPLDTVLVTAAAFRLERSNTRASDGLVTVQTGKSRVEGFEIAAVGEVSNFWKANLGYTYLDGELLTSSEFGTAGQRLQQLPRHQVTAWNRFDFTEKLGFGLGVIHQSSQFASFSNTVVLPSYWRVDAAAYYTASDRLSFQVNVENLLNEDYYPSAHGNNNIQPGEPFSVRFGVRLEL